MSPRGGFALRELLLAPGTTRPYDPDEWRDALVLVRAGAIELEDATGAVARFGAGDLLCLAPPLCALHNRGAEPALLLAISRERPVDGATGVPAGSSGAPGGMFGPGGAKSAAFERVRAPRALATVRAMQKPRTNERAKRTTPPVALDQVIGGRDNRSETTELYEEDANRYRGG